MTRRRKYALAATIVIGGRHRLWPLAIVPVAVAIVVAALWFVLRDDHEVAATQDSDRITVPDVVGKHTRDPMYQRVSLVIFPVW